MPTGHRAAVQNVRPKERNRRAHLRRAAGRGQGHGHQLAVRGDVIQLFAVLPPSRRDPARRRYRESDRSRRETAAGKSPAGPIHLTRTRPTGHLAKTAGSVLRTSSSGTRRASVSRRAAGPTGPWRSPGFSRCTSGTGRQRRPGTAASGLPDDASSGSSSPPPLDDFWYRLSARFEVLAERNPAPVGRPQGVDVAAGIERQLGHRGRRRTARGRCCPGSCDAPPRDVRPGTASAAKGRSHRACRSCRPPCPTGRTR